MSALGRAAIADAKTPLDIKWLGSVIDNSVRKSASSRLAARDGRRRAIMFDSPLAE